MDIVYNFYYSYSGCCFRGDKGCKKQTYPPL